MNHTATLSPVKKPWRRLLLACCCLFTAAQTQAGVTITIPSTPASDTTSFVPTNRRVAWSASRMIYTASEIGTTGTISQLGFYKESGSTSTAVNYIDIYLKETTSTTVTTTVPATSTYKKVYSGPIDNTMTSGWTTITLSTAPGDIFTFSGGTNNLDVLMIKGSFEPATTSFPIYTYTTTTGINTTAYYAGGTAVGASFTAVSQKRPNIQVTIESTCSGKPAGGLITGPTTAVCSGNNFTLNGLGITLGTGMHYQWQRRNAGSGSYANMTAADTFSSLTTSTTIDRDYRIVSMCVLSGQSDTSLPFTIKVLQTPVIAATGDTTFCSGSSVLLSTSAVAGVTYTWYRDGSTTGATGNTYTASTAGSYTVMAATAACSGVESNKIKVTVNTPPAASASAASATTFCDGDHVVLNANSGTGLSYQWQRIGVDISGASAQSYTATTSGAYRVKVTNTATGCFAFSSTINVTVNPTPAAPVISAPGGATSYCASGNLTLSTIPVSGVSYQWERSSGPISGATASSYTVNSPETYTLVATLGSCSSKSNAVKVTENPLPVAAITPSGTVSFCNGDSLEIRVSTASGQTYQWYEGTTPIPGATGSSFWAKTAAKYGARVTITATGCSDMSSLLEVNIISPTIPSIAATGPTSFCIGGDVTMTATTAPGLTLQWQESGSDIPGEISTNYTTATSGNYRMKVTNGVGCPAYSNVIVVTANPLPATSITVSGALNICDGETVTLTAPIVAKHSYQWLNSTIPVAGAVRNPFYAGKAGNYSVFITDSNGCQAQSSEVTVTVKNVTPFSIIPKGNTYFCDGDHVLLTTQTGFLSYQWSYNGVPIPGADGTSITAAKTGTYTVRVEDPINGCFASAPGYNITVIPSPDSPLINQSGARLFVYRTSGLKYQWYKNGVAIPGATDTSILSSGEELYSLQVTNIQECMKEGFYDLRPVGLPNTGAAGYAINVYPNPTSGILQIQAPEGITVTVSDVQGRLLFNERNSTSIDMSQLAAGMYLLRFTDDAGKVIQVSKVSKTSW